MSKIRVGFGYDVHRIVPDRPLWIGGIRIDAPFGLLGHSDADVLIHAICDALLGAASARDIGFHFPDTDEAYHDVDSKKLLVETVKIVEQKGYRVGNIDATICAEAPKLNPYVEQMQGCLAPLMHLTTDDVSLKATTTEELGFTGRREGIAAYAVALIEQAQ